MKTLLVFTLILCLTSMASAALQISVYGDWNPPSEIWTYPSDHLTLGIWTDTAMTAATTTDWALVCDPYCAVISGGTYVGPVGTYYDPDLEDYTNNIAGTLYSNTEGLIIPSGEDGIQGVITIYNSGLIPPDEEESYPTIPANTLLYDDIILHYESAEPPTPVHLYRFHNTAFTINSTQDTVTICTPEPAAICLLGFGALSLLRRKR